MALSQSPCADEDVPGTLIQRLNAAQELISQAAGTSDKREAKRLMRRGIKALKKGVRVAAKAANKKEISRACAASVANELASAKAGADQWLRAR